MIRIEVDGGDVRECEGSGNPFRLAGELAVAVRGIYYITTAEPDEE